MVDSAKFRTRVDFVHAAAEFLDAGAAWFGVEVAGEDDAVVLVGMVGNHFHDVVRRGPTCAGATPAHGEWAMVVDVEDGGAVGLVPQANPNSAALPIPLRVAILPNLRCPGVQNLPTILSVGQGQCMSAVHGLPLPRETFCDGIVHHTPAVVALLETHQVVAVIALSSSDQFASRTASPAMLVEEVPPEKVVSEDLHRSFGCGDALGERAGL
mmetsp:Transcript_20111/g.43838  ORF Transcript_20111/g.43838 Transcript_20111/m.43838 type:complete len:212 (-) Transcript_20111:467-1102(-)